MWKCWRHSNEQSVNLTNWVSLIQLYKPVTSRMLFFTTKTFVSRPCEMKIKHLQTETMTTTIFCSEVPQDRDVGLNDYITDMIYNCHHYNHPVHTDTVHPSGHTVLTYLHICSTWQFMRVCIATMSEISDRSVVCIIGITERIFTLRSSFLFCLRLCSSFSVNCSAWSVNWRCILSSIDFSCHTHRHTHTHAHTDNIDTHNHVIINDRTHLDTAKYRENQIYTSHNECQKRTNKWTHKFVWWQYLPLEAVSDKSHGSVVTWWVS